MSITRRLVSPITDAAGPFSFGHAFKDGVIPDSVVCTGAVSYQVTPLARWPSGYLKHASISGFASITASTNSPLFDNNPTVLTLSPGVPPAGTNLTSADLVAANPQASVQFGSLGTVNLSTLLSSAPHQVFQSGPKMSEFIYRGDAGSGNLLATFYYIRFWLGGRIEIEASNENSFLNSGVGNGISTHTVENYIPTVTIGGVMVYNNGGASQEHWYNTAWTSGPKWIGGDPQITALHDPVDLLATKLVPNYDQLSPAGSELDALAQTYTPNGIAGFRQGMGGGSFHVQIGLLPNWDALCVTSGDIRALRASETASRSLRSYRITFRDRLTNRAPKPSDFPQWTHSGYQQSSSDELATGTLTWEINHHPSAGYVAYILTGRPIHLATMEMQASAIYLVVGWADGNGLGLYRQVGMNQTRGVAWTLRTIGQYAAIAPTGDAVAAEYRTLLQNNYDYWYTQGPGSSTAKQLGYPYSVGSYDSSQPMSQSPWMYHFWMAVNGHIMDADPGFAAPSMTKMVAFTKWMYKGIVGILGTTGTTNFHFTKAESYNVNLSPLVINDPAGRYNSDYYWDNWGQVYQGTFGVANTNTSNTLENLHGLDPWGYWANLKPAAAMAAEHGVPGAAAAWGRLTGATNSATFLNSGFNNTPIWGVGPRQIVTIPPEGTPPPVITPTAGLSTRVERPLTMAVATHVGNNGMGLLGSAMAATGLSGPGYIKPSLTSGDDNFEIAGPITQWPTLGTLTLVDESGKFQYVANNPSASDYFLWKVVVGGIDSTDNTLGYGPGISRVDLIVGTTITGVTVTPSTATGSTTFSKVVAGTGTPPQTVNWTTTAGSVNSSGVFTAPAATTSVQTITVRATSTLDGTKFGIATVTIAAIPLDGSAPTMIGSLTPSAITTTGFVLSWQAAADNVAVTDYEVSTDNGTTYASIGVTLTHPFSGLIPNTAYLCKVRALDAAGNPATPLSLTVTTLQIGIPPVMTGVITESNITETSFTLSWPAATDNIAVIGYEASIDGGTTYEDLGNVLTVDVINLTASTLYLCLVRAYDADANRSAPLAKAIETLVFSGLYIASPHPYPSPARISHFVSPKR